MKQHLAVRVLNSYFSTSILISNRQEMKTQNFKLHVKNKFKIKALWASLVTIIVMFSMMKHSIINIFTSLYLLIFPFEKPAIAPGSHLPRLMTEAVAFVFQCCTATASFQGHYFLLKS